MSTLFFATIALPKMLMMVTDLNLKMELDAAPIIEISRFLR